MHNCISRLERLVEWLMALALAVMVALVFGNVVLRYAFDSGIAAAEEVSRLMFVWLVFLGAILAVQQNSHLGVEMVQARLSPAWRRGCAVLSHLLMLYALWLFLQGSWSQTLIGLETYSTVLAFPMALFAGAGLLCAVAMLLLIAANLYRIVRRHPHAQIPGSPDSHSTGQDL
ncbi:TRAP transporter small permease [Vogesella indigofera]|uniref:TRAP transporter small permease n=1 Tax=Vogesella indigofera TaxID=45465 RepID=UPI00234E95A8|nr:TRAP transporter small permease [Vogesella indigofera]MDC7701521.1 TRAP transporter small permease [Vogesella indigofera]